MELNELKDKYNAIDQIKYSRKELKGIFEIRTKRAVKNVNRAMFSDALAMLLTATALIAATFLLGLTERYLIALEIAALAVVLLIHYRVKYVLLNSIDLSESGIRQGVTRLCHRVKSYMLAYKVIVPLFVVALYLKTIIILDLLTFEYIIMTLPIAFTIYLITRFLCVKIYGEDLNRLQTLSKELEND